VGADTLNIVGLEDERGQVTGKIESVWNLAQRPYMLKRTEKSSSMSAIIYLAIRTAPR
jgi:hypothetical protein